MKIIAAAAFVAAPWQPAHAQAIVGSIPEEFRGDWCQEIFHSANWQRDMLLSRKSRKLPRSQIARVRKPVRGYKLYCRVSAIINCTAEYQVV